MFSGLLQRCPSPPVRNFITFGSPHQGVFGVPECKSTTGSPVLCELVRRLLSEGAYIPWIQGTPTLLQPGLSRLVRPHHACPVLAQPPQQPGVPGGIPLPRRHQQREAGEELGVQGEPREAGELCDGQVAAGHHHHSWSFRTVRVLPAGPGERVEVSQVLLLSPWRTSSHRTSSLWLSTLRTGWV